MRHFRVVLLLVVASTLIAQESATKSTPKYEYGSWRELKDVKLAFVDTGPDLELRDEIATAVKTQLGQLVQIADSESEADVVITYEGGVRSLGDGMWKARWGNGAVFKKVDENTIRLLITFKRPEETYRVGFSFTRDFINTFVKSYREANRLDKNNRSKP